MTRFLLALLAIITGFTATGQPALARLCASGRTEVGTIGLQLTVEDTAIRNQRPTAPLAQAPSLIEREACCKPQCTTVYIPTVQLRADRARE